MTDGLGVPGGERFPGFDALALSAQWDDATRAVVLSRIVDQPPMRFFSEAEEAVARMLVRRLLDLHEHPGSEEPDVVRMIDGRLAEQQTDGWHYDSMPPDDEAWRMTMHALDEDAVLAGHAGFAAAPDKAADRLISRVQTHPGDWHGMEASRVWSLWTRYASTAFYSHPSAWNEMGFPGPAYPRGYKNLGVDAREPFEVRDSRPHDDPERKTG